MEKQREILMEAAVLSSPLHLEHRRCHRPPSACDNLIPSSHKVPAGTALFLISCVSTQGTQINHQARLLPHLEFKLHLCFAE